MEDRLIISGLEFFGHCGITVEEQKTGQRFSVKLEMACDIRQAAKSDRLEDAVDYAAVSKKIIEIGRDESFHLIEAMAERIANVLLKEFGIHEVKLMLKKLHPPIEPIMKHAAVEIHRSS